MLNRIFLGSLLFLFSSVAFSQSESDKLKFQSEKTIHFKVGCNFNNLNTSLFKLLNTQSSDVFTSLNSLNYSPLAQVEFDNQLSKHWGINLALGFMQTRHNYHYESFVTSSSNIANVNGYTTDGLILCNIPHINLSPSFYISNTRFNIGVGLYKYYFTFKPLSAGNYWFNPNSETNFIYSNVGITQVIEIKGNRMTLSANYYGFAKKFDNGFQLAIGISI
jgi:hypothetical protein